MTETPHQSATTNPDPATRPDRAAQRRLAHDAILANIDETLAITRTQSAEVERLLTDGAASHTLRQARSATPRRQPSTPPAADVA